MLREDLQAALGAWVKTPLLPVLSAVVLIGFNGLPLGAVGGLVAVFIGILGVGWLGTERLWYRQVFDGIGVSVSELWLATWRYFPRYLVLGLVVGLLLVPQLVWVQVVGRFTSTMALVQSFSLAAVTVLLAFVLPALAFTTRRVRDGIRIGLRILREDWPRCLWYALPPALTFLLVGRLSVLQAAVPGFVWTLLATVMSVAFDGAVVRYYLRREKAVTD
jgi:hypothetical protein